MGDDGRVAIILGDQAYPPLWDCGGDKACVNILRVEYAMLHELAEELISKLRGRYVAAVSIILMFSATNLEAYCEDLVSAIKMLKRSIGEHVIYTALPHFVGGCGDEATVRLAVEVGVWAPHYFGGERVFLKQSFVKANEILLLLEAGIGGPQLALNLRLRLPDSSSSSGAKQWIIEGLVGLPTALKLASISQERALYDALAGELRSGLALDMEPSPEIDRAVKAAASSGGNLVTTDVMLICGGSNAQRLQKAMQEQGIAADLLHIPNLSVREAQVRSLLLN
jgi:hypothetical protein